MNLSDCATKAEMNGATDIYTSTLALKTDLASLKTKKHNLCLDKT